MRKGASKTMRGRRFWNYVALILAVCFGPGQHGRHKGSWDYVFGDADLDLDIGLRQAEKNNPGVARVGQSVGQSCRTFGASVIVSFALLLGVCLAILAGTGTIDVSTAFGIGSLSGVLLAFSYVMCARRLPL